MLRAAEAESQAEASRALIRGIIPYTAAGAASIETVPAIWDYNIVSNTCSIIPTLSRSFVAAPFQLGLVWLSALSTLPPNPSACPRVGVRDKPWDKFANYFETASPQFHFCPGDKNGLVLRPRNVRYERQNSRLSSSTPVWQSES